MIVTLSIEQGYQIDGCENKTFYSYGKKFCDLLIELNAYFFNKHFPHSHFYHWGIDISIKLYQIAFLVPRVLSKVSSKVSIMQFCALHCITLHMHFDL